MDKNKKTPSLAMPLSFLIDFMCLLNKFKLPSRPFIHAYNAKDKLDIRKQTRYTFTKKKCLYM